MKNFEYLVPETVQQACSYLAEYGEEAKVIAGGQSLVIMLKHGLIEPAYLIDLKALSNLQYLSFDEKNGLRLGALTTHRTVETSVIIKKHYEVLSKAEETLATIQIRNYGTVGGNLCHADPSTDLAPPLIALGAKVKLSGAKGERQIPLEEFFVDYYECVLGADEILTEIQIPRMPANTRGTYRKYSLRKTDSPIVGGTVMVSFGSGKQVCQDTRIVLSAVGPVPLRIKRAEGVLKGERITSGLIEEVAQIASEEVEPVSDVRASKEYKKKMVKVLVKGMINEIVK